MTSLRDQIVNSAIKLGNTIAEESSITQLRNNLIELLKQAVDSGVGEEIHGLTKTIFGVTVEQVELLYQSAIKRRREYEATLADLRLGDCSLLHFYLEGGVSVHGSDGAPRKDITCSTEIFLALQKNGVLKFVRQCNTGYPYYTNNAKSCEYQLA